MTRRERKQRVWKLTASWMQETCFGLSLGEKEEQLFERFQRFCVINQIDQPQDASLRDQILIRAGDILMEANRRFKEQQKEAL